MKNDPSKPEPFRWQSSLAIGTLRRWFGVRESIRPLDYAVCGVLLMLLKYAVEAGLIWKFAQRIFYPWDFLNPLMSAREALVRGAPDWLPWTLILWTLPFFWVAISMSVRRAADAGCSPWLGLLVIVPLFNLPFMLTMCMSPTQPERNHWSPRHEQARDTDHAKSAALAAGVGLLVGGTMLLCSVYLFASYGASLFLGTPRLSATQSYSLRGTLASVARMTPNDSFTSLGRQSDRAAFRFPPMATDRTLWQSPGYLADALTSAKSLRTTRPPK